MRNTFFPSGLCIICRPKPLRESCEGNTADQSLFLSLSLTASLMQGATDVGDELMAEKTMQGEGLE